MSMADALWGAPRDWKQGIFGHYVTARSRTGQLRHLGKRPGLTLGLEFAFVDRFVLVGV